jgi:hypothetical protein
MRNEDVLDYHRRRAMRELDLGLTAECPNAARAHLTLSSLHLQRLRQAGGEQGNAPLLQM